MNSINTLGEDVTFRLKKVSDELKTHKNPQLRQQAGQLNKQSKNTIFSKIFFSRQSIDF
jgi:hypothetical protein